MMSGEPLNVAIAGLGTVGASVFRMLLSHAELYEWRTGRPLRVVAVSARSRASDRGVDLSGVTWVDNPLDLVKIPGVNAMVELIGGPDDPALSLARGALSRRIPFVTANKALLSRHWTELVDLARANETPLRFEAAVAGAVPVIKILCEGMASNRVTRILGILNGTCNYILSTMERTERDFATVLQESQTLGYAESDPSFDIDGVDTAHKLSLLAALAFGLSPNPDGLPTRGIRNLTLADVRAARGMGYRIKLLGQAEWTWGGVSLSVDPVLVPLSHPLAQVDDVMNAVTFHGDASGDITLTGRGAGGMPTASAVVSDLIDLARGRGGRRLPVFPPGEVVCQVAAPPEEPAMVQLPSARLKVLDRG